MNPLLFSRPTTLTAALLVALFLSSPITWSQAVKNPYADVNWDQVTAYKANFHAHTVRSDGRAEPGHLIHMYAEGGYDILSVTDHDNYYTHREGERDVIAKYIHRDGNDRVPTSETTWPWTRWIDEEPSKIWVYRGIESSAFYPDLGNRGMLAVRGAELTTHPHIASLFNRCGWPHRNQTDDERLACVEENGGLAYWVHPTHYVEDAPWEGRFFDDPAWENAVEYFGRYIAEYESMLGFEMRVHGDRLARDLELFDRLLERYYPDHDIFIKGSDDSHGRSVREDASMTLVLAKELTEESVRHALENGHNLVGSRAESYPELTGIEIDEDTRMITLDIANYERVRWIRDGEEYATGPTFDFSELAETVLRFEIDQAGATFYSQGFYVR